MDELPLDTGRRTDSDRALYGAAVEGDREAVRMLVERHHHQLIAYCIASGWAHNDAEDAVQLAWMRFFQHVQSAGKDVSKVLHKPESLRFWLITTTLNALRQEHRSSQRRDALAKRATQEASARGQLVDDPDYLEPLEIEEQRSQLRGAFARLSEACRQLIGLLLFDPPLSYDEISELTGRPRGSIGPTRRRCIEQLRSAIENGGS